MYTSSYIFIYNILLKYNDIITVTVNIINFVHKKKYVKFVNETFKYYDCIIYDKTYFMNIIVLTRPPR